MMVFRIREILFVMTLNWLAWEIGCGMILNQMEFKNKENQVLKM